MLCIQSLRNTLQGMALPIWPQAIDFSMRLHKIVCVQEMRFRVGFRQESCVCGQMNEFADDNNLSTTQYEQRAFGSIPIYS